MRDNDGTMVLVLMLVFGMLCGLSVYVSTPVSAQQKPYQAYKVYGGCLYITPQGYAVLSPTPSVSTPAECQ